MLRVPPIPEVVIHLSGETNSCWCLCHYACANRFDQKGREHTDLISFAALPSMAAEFWVDLPPWCDQKQLTLSMAVVGFCVVRVDPLLSHLSSTFPVPVPATCFGEAVLCVWEAKTC